MPSRWCALHKPPSKITERKLNQNLITHGVLHLIPYDILSVKEKSSCRLLGKSPNNLPPNCPKKLRSNGEEDFLISFLDYATCTNLEKIRGFCHHNLPQRVQLPLKHHPVKKLGACEVLSILNQIYRAQIKTGRILACQLLVPIREFVQNKTRHNNGFSRTLLAYKKLAVNKIFWINMHTIPEHIG